MQEKSKLFAIGNMKKISVKLKKHLDTKVVSSKNSSVLQHWTMLILNSDIDLSET